MNANRTQKQQLEKVDQTQSIRLESCVNTDFSAWLDRELNVLVGRWIEYSSPNSIGNYDEQISSR